MEKISVDGRPPPGVQFQQKERKCAGVRGANGRSVASRPQTPAFRPTRMIFNNAEPWSFWERLADFGTLLVILGVAGEGIEISAKLGKLLKKKWKRFQAWLARSKKLAGYLHWCEKHELEIELLGLVAWVFVVVGLVVEFGGNHKARLLAAADNANLKKQAGKAFYQASLANERVALLESTNLVLRKEVLEMEEDAQRSFGPWEMPVLKPPPYPLTEFSNVEAFIRYTPTDDSKWVAFGIAENLRNAGWRLGVLPSTVTVQPWQPGVRVAVNGAAPSLLAMRGATDPKDLRHAFQSTLQAKNAAVALLSTLTNFGVPAETMLAGSKQPLGSVLVLVGPKPNPLADKRINATLERWTSQLSNGFNSFKAYQRVMPLGIDLDPNEVK